MNQPIIIKSLLPSLFQREESCPSFSPRRTRLSAGAKWGEGRFHNEILLEFLLVAILSFLVWAGNAHALDIGDSAPDFHVETIDGKEISYHKDVKGKKPLYLIFWATW